MKKILTLMLALALVLSLSAPALATEKPVINLWTTGSQNVADLFNALIAEYNALPEAKTEVKLQFLLSGTGDETMLSRISSAYLSGQKDTEFDMIAENTASLQPFIDESGTEDIFLTLDFDQIPNYKDITLKPSMLQDKVVPYRGTTVVFAYDSARVSEDELPHTWEELTQWIKDHPGRFAYNEPSTGGAGSAFVRTAVYRFIPDKSSYTSVDPIWAQQWDEGFAWLAEVHPFLYQSGGSVIYVAKNQGTLDLLINQEVDIIPAWADQVLANIAQGTLPETTRMYQLDDAALTGTDVSMAILSIGKAQDAAYDFMNYVISPAGQKIALENMKAIPVIDPSRIDSAEKDLVADLKVENFAFMSIGNLGDVFNERWNEEIMTLK
ncbi:MAG: extracellular solute-binding protein [Clostridiales bacterium]|nr:extracellular solute-binding protein [Clostridiales bacterium]